MIIKSFIKDYTGLRPIDVEVECINGLQQITILGLPDKIIQESTKKIQSALLNQGFHMPRGKQILVSLSPREIKKSSLGVELAIALGILWISGQKPMPTTENLDALYVYGELSLAGGVFAPEDIDDICFENVTLLTGERKGPAVYDMYCLDQLQSEFMFTEGKELEAKTNGVDRPLCRQKEFPAEVAQLLQVSAVGEHHILLAGPAGSGKTTFAESLSCFLKEPDIKIFREYRRIGRHFGDVWPWRPVVQPHHTSTQIAMIGGGNPILPGEISRAHGGVLIVDELLEFHPHVQSALREPMEQGWVRVARSGDRKTLPAQALVVGTTNLCRCGEFSPGKFKQCRCSSQNLRRYLERLSGPFVDRFSILALSAEWPFLKATTKISREIILENCLKAYDFQKKQRGQTVSNQSLTESQVVQTFSDPHWFDLLPEVQSQRRRLSLLRVARTLADLDHSEKILLKHIRVAEKLSVLPFFKIKSLF